MTYRLPRVLALTRTVDKRPVLGSYAAAALLVGLTIAAAFVFKRLPHANMSLPFLTVVLVIAARWGLWPSVFASLLSFLALNYFFTQPLYTFAVEEEGDFATLLFFLIMAGLTGNLAARMRNEMANNRAALERVSYLLDFSRRMAAARGAREALSALADRLSTVCDTRVAVLKPDSGGELGLEALAEPRARRQNDFDIGPLSAAWRTLAAGGSGHLPGWQLFRLTSSGRTVGLAAIETAELEREQRDLIEALCDQAATANERAELVEGLRAAQLVSETERLRSGLLASVSHDLRTPLVSIIGSTTSLLEYRSILKPGDRDELLQTVLDEAQRLNRYIQNLLDMTRFGQEPFDLDRQWVDLNDLISSAIERLGSALAHVTLQVDVAHDATLLKVQGTLIEQVIVNLLDNAAGFAPESSTIVIRAYRDSGDTVMEVTNDGPAIPEPERDKIFDMFYRAAQGDRKRPGAGLGLTICRSIVAAHGGTIAAESRPDLAETTLRLRLPLELNPVDSNP